jgi:MOSC domain-containing protein YiiM
VLLRSVNLSATLEPQVRGKDTAFGKRPVSGPVEVRAPGPRRGGAGSGLVGDRIGNTRYHGGDDQAVYAYSRAVLDHWQDVLGRELADGAFGENLTISGGDVDAAVLGERWRVGTTVVLQVTAPRVPCQTFRQQLGVRGWLRRFTEDGRSGAYLRVVEPGPIAAGDPVEVVHTPTHGITVTDAFRALLVDRSLRPGLLAAGDDLCAQLRRVAARV